MGVTVRYVGRPLSAAVCTPGPATSYGTDASLGLSFHVKHGKVSGTMAT